MDFQTETLFWKAKARKHLNAYKTFCDRDSNIFGNVQSGFYDATGSLPPSLPEYPVKNFHLLQRDLIALA
jgi:hypothetical protein